MPTAAQISIIDREIALLKSGAMSGDFMRRPGQRGIGQAEQKMIRQLSIAKMQPAEKIAFDKRELAAKKWDASRRAFINAFKNINVAALTKAKTNASIERLRALSLDDSNPDQWLLFYRAIQARQIVGVPLGKFRFNWDANGKPVFVAWTEQSWENFFRQPQRGRWIPNIPFMYKCPPEWETHWIKEYMGHSENAAKQFTSNDPRHVWQYKSGDAKCKRKKKSLWVKVRKVVVGAVAVVAAVYLGPIVLEKVGGMLAGASGSSGAGAGAGAATGSAATATKTAVFINKVKSAVTIYNKVNTVAHIVQGKIPPPPIGITGGTFRTVAFNLVKQKIKDEAIDAAMEQGVKYIEKKMTEKEERAIMAEIAALQREMDSLVPKGTPIMPSPELPEKDRNAIVEIQTIQKKREQNNTAMAALAIGAGLFLVTG